MDKVPCPWHVAVPAELDWGSALQSPCLPGQADEIAPLRRDDIRDVTWADRDGLRVALGLGRQYTCVSSHGFSHSINDHSPELSRIYASPHLEGGHAAHLRGELAREVDRALRP
jgi:hypothetical protein